MQVKRYSSLIFVFSLTFITLILSGRSHAAPYDSLAHSVNDSYSKGVLLAIDQPQAVVDLILVPIDSADGSIAPYLSPQNRTMVPLRFVADALGLEVSWKADTEEIHLKSAINNSELTLFIGSKIMKHNQKGALTLDTEPRIINNRTFVPLRAISEGLSMYVDYHGSVLSITTSKPSQLLSEDADMHYFIKDWIHESFEDVISYLKRN